MQAQGDFQMESVKRSQKTHGEQPSSKVDRTVEREECHAFEKTRDVELVDILANGESAQLCLQEIT